MSDPPAERDWPRRIQRGSGGAAGHIWQDHHKPDGAVPVPLHWNYGDPAAHAPGGPGDQTPSLTQARPGFPVVFGAR